MSKKTQRFNLQLPEPLFLEIKALADENGCSVAEMIRRLAKAGMELHLAEADPDRAVIKRDARGERELIFI